MLEVHFVQVAVHNMRYALAEERMMLDLVENGVVLTCGLVLFQYLSGRFARHVRGSRSSKS